MTTESPITGRAAILQALVLGSGYGNELIARVKRRTRGRVVLRQGSMYPALHAMEKIGLLTSWETAPRPERGGRAQRHYKLAAAGRRAAAWQSKAILSLFGVTS
jgi:PadR family transcriptional regulator PadR